VFSWVEVRHSSRHTGDYEMPENYQVYKIPKALRQAVKADRLDGEQRLAGYLDVAVDEQLDQIVDSLNALGIKAQETRAC